MPKSAREVLTRRLKILEFLIDEKLEKHPVPWTTEDDGWGVAVLDAKGDRVFFGYDWSDARLLTHIARLRNRQNVRLDRWSEAYEKALASDDENAPDEVMARPWPSWDP
jgi:hypothetical protein